LAVTSFLAVKVECRMVEGGEVKKSEMEMERKRASEGSRSDEDGRRRRRRKDRLSASS
jgi:hypothetical protein